MTVEEFTGEKSIILEFYRLCKTTYEPSISERFFTARQNGEVVGAVRLCIEEGVHMLRTMQIRDDKKSLGIGTRILNRFEPEIRNVDCYCMPYEHLVDFYGKIGFTQIPDGKAPQFLQERLQRVRDGKDGKKYIIMMRPADIIKS